MNKARSRVAALSALAILAASVSSVSPISYVSASPHQAQTKALPASMPFADGAFENVWTRNDQPVAAKQIARSWTWGPAPLATGLEVYTDAPDGTGKRLVQYFDKSR